jgi:hypothetical protein
MARICPDDVAFRSTGEVRMGHTALLVVHGIGAQEPGETLAKLANGLRRVQPQSVPDAIHDGVVVAISGRTVRLYEV